MRSWDRMLWMKTQENVGLFNRSSNSITSVSLLSRCLYPGQLLCIMRIDLSVFRVADGLMESMNVKAAQSGEVLLNRRWMKVVGFLIGRSVILVISPYWKHKAPLRREKPTAVTHLAVIKRLIRFDLKRQDRCFRFLLIIICKTLIIIRIMDNYSHPKANVYRHKETLLFNLTIYYISNKTLHFTQK